MPCMAKLKLNMDGDGVPYMEGFLEPVTGSRYDWKSFFFIRQPDGMMVDIGPNLQKEFEFETGKEVHYIDYLLDLNPSKTNAQYEIDKKFMMTSAGVQKDFHLLTELEVTNGKFDKYQYFVEYSGCK